MFDLGTLRESGDRVLYDPSHLTTHGVVFGMTGSGKTGLCVGLLEEAGALDIPVIAIDPKGDLANLALCWPSLAPSRFAEWVDPAAANAKGTTAEALGGKLAGVWRDGLAGAGYDEASLQRYRDRTGIRVYTPGSSAGLPVSILNRFDPPPGFAQMAPEDRDEAISAVVAALLGLVDVDADPLQSRPYILIANILSHHWQAGRGLDLGALIRDVAEPPLERLGVFELDKFISGRKRQDLAMRLNGLVASPGFAAWREGAPLDVGALFERTPKGSRTSIFSIAHLDDNERMAFVSLLLDRIVAWMRAQPGTGELRALLYFDEVFGYLPPYPRNPASKRPLLTLLKQARAFGLGVVLATQNPVDIDYKGITNAGTWMIGRLQTEQDKDRVLDGLMSASGAGTDRGAISRQISDLQPREFLFNNARNGTQGVFKSRFVRSFLRGPMTRSELSRLKDVDFYNAASAPGAPASVGPPVAPRPESSTPVEIPSPLSSPISAAPSPGDAWAAEIVEGGQGPAETVEWIRPAPGQVVEMGPPAASGDVAGRRAALGAAPPPRTNRATTGPILTERWLRRPDLELEIEGWQGALPWPLLPAGPTGGAGQERWEPTVFVRARLQFHTAGTPGVSGPSAAPLPAQIQSAIGTPTSRSGGASQLAWRLFAPTTQESTVQVGEPLFPDPASFASSPPGRGPRVRAPLPDWIHRDEADTAIRRSFTEHLSRAQTLSTPTCPPLGKVGRPGESLDDFRRRLAVQLGRAAQRLVGRHMDRHQRDLALMDDRLEQAREMLVMDQRELTQLKAAGEQRALSLAQDRTRFNMQRYKDLKSQRALLEASGQREAADPEFAVMDHLAACRLANISLASQDVKVLDVFILWIPHLS